MADNKKSNDQEQMVNLKVINSSKNNFGGQDYILSYIPKDSSFAAQMYTTTVPSSVADKFKEQDGYMALSLDLVLSAYANKGMFGWKKIFIVDPTRPLPAK